MKHLYLVVALLSSAFGQAPSVIAIRNAKIVPVSGAILAKGTVVMRNGLIEDVGETAAVPPDAWVIDGEGLTVYPGLIDAMSNWGMPANLSPPARPGQPQTTGPVVQGNVPAPPTRPYQGPEDRPATTSWIKAADELQIADRRLETARSAGFTNAVTFPMRGIFAGQGAVINLAGEKPRDMVLIPSVGQYLTMAPSGNGFPSALFGTISYIRQIYLDAEHYTAVKQAYAKDPRGVPRPEYERALEGVIESNRVLLPANRMVEIDRMIRFAGELKHPAILYGMREGYRSIDLLAKAGLPVLVSLKWPVKDTEADPDDTEPFRTLEVRDRAPSSPSEFQKAHVKFALYTDSVEQPRDVQKAVKKAMDAGLSREDAVRALTLSAAEMFGVADRLGSIEKGKIANLVVTRGDIFEERTKIEMVFIDGKRFTPPPEPPPPTPVKPTANTGNAGGRPQ
jgi:imidazolonepropionase-like amidohydrolase